MLRFAAVALAALALTLQPASAQRYGEPGEFDFYVLSLSWSPSYCDSAGQRADPSQCRAQKPLHFVVHGFWPQYDRGFPADCAYNAPRVSEQTIRELREIMPSRGLVIYQWRKHGTCSGLSPDKYFGLLRQAFDKVKIPPQFSQVTKWQTVSPPEVENAFRTANPGLSADMISVTCDRKNLREVRICMSKDLQFRSCPQVDRQACRNPRVSLPPVRG